ncbi:hypothetical protein [Segetibacter koreensis]|uniref:hypothetical protein n=1 Tax=Segetibacter koreensis TaxID=398037 RepID=UPI00037DA596|nr:hypothetical protein [Segetibacter koreensis]
MPDKDVVFHANRWIIPFLKEEAEGGEQGIDDWSIFNLPEAGEGEFVFTEKNVQEIYDINENLLFVDFVALMQNNKEVRCRVNIADLSFPKVISYGVNSPLQIQSKVDEALKKAGEQYLTGDEKETRIYAYAYPKLGIKVKDKSGNEFVMDIGDKTIIPLETRPIGSTEYIGIYSMINLIDAVEKDLSKELYNSSKLPNYPDLFIDVASNVRNDSDLTLEKKISGFTLIPQQKSNYCAVAVGEMILKFFQFSYEQDRIAEVMRVQETGALNDDQIRALRELSNNTLTCLLDLSPSFNEAVMNINILRPLKSGIPRHARAIAGWKTIKAENNLTEWVYVYDPWPVNEGNIYWEDWTSVRHTNYILLPD